MQSVQRRPEKKDQDSLGTENLQRIQDLATNEIAIE